MDDAFALPVHGDWVAPLRQAIVGGYTGAPIPDKGLPVITYLSRQSTHMRKMTQKAHEDLEAELKKLEQDGIAEFNTVEFSDKDPKDYQAAVLARTTVRGRRALWCHRKTCLILRNVFDRSWLGYMATGWYVSRSQIRALHMSSRSSQVYRSDTLDVDGPEQALRRLRAAAKGQPRGRLFHSLGSDEHETLDRQRRYVSRKGH